MGAADNLVEAADDAARLGGQAAKNGAEVLTRELATNPVFSKWTNKPLPELPNPRTPEGGTQALGEELRDPEKFRQSFQAAQAGADRSGTAAGAAPTPGPRGPDDPPREKPGDPNFNTDATNEIKLKFPELTTGKIFGLGAAAYVAYMSVVMIGTDGADVEIESIKIEDDPNSDNRIVTITYDPSTVRLANTRLPGTADAFRPSKYDGVDIPSSVGIGGPTYRITDDPIGNNVKIVVPDTVDISNLMAGVSPPYAEPGDPFIRTWSSNRPRMTVYTSFLNQLTGVMETMMALATTVITRIINIAASALPPLVKAATDATGFVFCSTFPILCNMTFWIGIVIFIVAIIILMVLYKKK